MPGGIGVAGCGVTGSGAVVDDQVVVAHIEQVWDSLGAFCERLDDAEWRQPTECPGWSVQDNLAHLLGIEYRLLGRETPEHALADGALHVRNDLGRWNEAWVASMRAFPGAQVLAEFRAATAERLATLRAYTTADFDAESWTPLGPGTVRDMLPFRLVDSWVHELDMRRAVNRPGNLDTPAARYCAERLLGAMGMVLGKRVAPPDGTAVVFDMTGPTEMTRALRVDDGRAVVVDNEPVAPTAVIRTDTDTFVRLATGRGDHATMLAAGLVTVDGDKPLGEAVVGQMNLLF